MKELRLKRLTQARMEQWLRENRTQVFKTSDAFDCPVNKFLKSVYPKAKIYTVGIYGGNITPEGRREMRRFHLPKWARIFVSKIDSTHGGLSNTISSMDALDVLTSI